MDDLSSKKTQDIYSGAYKEDHDIRVTDTHNVSYWDSPKALCIFSPQDNESVTDAFIRRDDILSKAVFDDKYLLSITSDIKDLTEITSLQQQNLRLDTMYLRKVYQITLHTMHTSTWLICCNIAISDIYDTCTTYI